MGNEIYFDTALGGYVKNDVIEKIEAYNKLIDEIDRMMISDASINAELLKIVGNILNIPDVDEVKYDNL